VYAHVIAPDEVDPDALALLIDHGQPKAAEKHGRDARVMHASPDSCTPTEKLSIETR